MSGQCGHCVGIRSSLRETVSPYIDTGTSVGTFRCSGEKPGSTLLILVIVTWKRQDHSAENRWAGQVGHWGTTPCPDGSPWVSVSVTRHQKHQSDCMLIKKMKLHKGGKATSENG